MTPLHFHLTVSPLQFKLADAAKTSMVLHVRNDGQQPIDTEPGRFELTVNGETSFVFMMGSNRVYENKWFALPPGDSLEQDYSYLAADMFTKPGTYTLQLKWLNYHPPVNEKIDAAVVTVVVE